MSSTLEYTNAVVTTDKVRRDEKTNRRFRHIIANSGLEMESGEVRDIEILHVMGTDGELINVNDLKKPEQEARRYTVQAALNHGHVDEATGEREVGVEDIIGDAKVWVEDGQLHAYIYFANDDPKADHAYAVSDNASYSIGSEWYPEGYEGAGQVIDQPIGILREISMVSTGNDPRAKTIDSKTGKAQRSAADGETNLKKGNHMSDTKKKTVDELTPDEARRLHDVIDELTADIPEGEEQPTRRDSTEEGEKADAPAEEGEKADSPAADAKTTDNVKHMPIVVIKDRAVKQEKAVKKTDWLFTKDARKRFAEIAYQNGGFKGSFDSLWAQERAKHGSTATDGITGLNLPVDGRQLIVDALEKPDGIISHFDFIGGKTYLVKLISAAEGNNAESARAGGHLKGDTKLFQQLKSEPRQFYNVPVYKKLDIDYLELYENPELVQIRARELVDARIVEIERAMLIGDGRTAPAEGSNQPDRRMFRGGRGFYSIAADAASSEGVGKLFATAVNLPAGTNMVDAAIYGEDALRAEGDRIMVAKKAKITGARTQRLGANGTGDYLIPRGTSVEAALGVSRIYTPAWMDEADCDFIIFVNNTPKLIGQAPASPDMKAFFDTTNDTDVLMAEAPNGGGLAAYKAAAVVTIAQPASA